MTEAVPTPASESSGVTPPSPSTEVPVGTIDQALGVTTPEKPAEAAPAPEAPEAPKVEEPKPTEGEAPVTIDALSLPEGLLVDDAQKGEFNELVKGMPKDQAQKILDYGAQRLKAAAEEPLREWKAKNDEWVKEVKSDPKIGGDNWDATKTRITKMLDTHGDPGLGEALAFTGAGNHPAVIRTLNNLALLLTEGGAVTGKPAGAPQSAAQLFYPNQPSSGT